MRLPLGASLRVSPPVLFANQPQIALGFGGEALVAWYQSEGAPLMTYASQRRRALESPVTPPLPQRGEVQRPTSRES